MAYTTIDDPTEYFNTVLYSGTGSSNTISVGFQPDFTWIKRRNSARDHQLFNSTTGANTVLSSNLNSAEEGTGAGGWTPNSDGFVVHQHVKTNSNGDTYVGWNWKAETSFTNDASSTSVGSIDSAGSVNTDAGFSIITYTGTGSAATIAHGLGAAPAMILFKNRSRATNWLVYHKDIAATKFLYLNVTDQAGTDSGHFNDTEPTSSVFSVGGADGTNYSGENLIACCFAEKQGYSKFGIYTGNNIANGTFVYTGFKPAFLMVKLIDTQTDGWVMQDNKRDISNTGTSTRVRANTDAADFDGTNEIDFLSNGFKLRGADGEINGNGSKHIYMAFAENPFVTSTGVPATAR